MCAWACSKRHELGFLLFFMHSTAIVVGTIKFLIIIIAADGEPVGVLEAKFIVIAPCCAHHNRRDELAMERPNVETHKSL